VLLAGVAGAGIIASTAGMSITGSAGRVNGGAEMGS
jgi:hypothetical protein